MNFRVVRAIVAIAVLALFVTIGSSYHVQASEPLNNHDKQVVAVNESPFSLASASGGAVLHEVAGAVGPAQYIVQFQDAPLASYRGGVAGLAATSPAATNAPKLEASSPASRAYRAYLAEQRSAAVEQISQTIGRSDLTILHVYDVAYNGLAVELTPEEAAAAADLPLVKRVVRSFDRYPLTDITPDFVNASGIWDGSNVPEGMDGVLGEGMVVGIIDTGINMSHPSFAATDGDGYEHTNPRAEYFGWCDPGHPNYNPALNCNDKLIGVYAYASSGMNPIDADGHGSHVASTAAGNVLYDIEYDDVTFGRISGIAPRANIISYRVCLSSCALTAILAGIDDATEDAVDVINYSIGGGPSDPWSDPDSEAFLNARDAGVFVAAAAGNEGPGAGTVSSPANAPWLTSVANTTISRIIANTLDVTGPEPVPTELQGIAAVRGTESPEITTDIEAGIVFAGDIDAGNVLGCNAFPADAFADSIALIQRGTCPFSDKINNADDAGAVAVIIYNNAGGPPIVMSMPGTSLHAVFVTDVDGMAIRDWVQAETDPTVRINAGTASISNPDWADIMANLSSRGPNVNPDWIKPDIGAPGTNILAAFAGAADNYGMISGTSMASPHVAGAATLLRQLYPSWTPAEIQSALMMTSLSGVVVKEDAATPSDPFDVGAGRLDLTNAALVGLVLDETTANFEAADPALGGDPTTLNLASLADSSCLDVCSWMRTFTSVAQEQITYVASVDAPAGMMLTVDPASFAIDPGASQTLTITADVTALPNDVWAFAEIQLTPSAGEAVNDFSGDFALEQWTFSNDPPDVAGSFDSEPGPPVELYVTGGDDGEGGFTDFWITIPADGIISFDWGYQTLDEDCWDSGGVTHNGVYDELACNADAVPFFEESYSLAVSAGDEFGFSAWTADGDFGAGTFGVTNFSFQATAGAGVHLPLAVMPRFPVASIDVNPDELSAEQKPDTVTNHTLTIHNNGGIDLEWTIAEEPMPAAVELSLGEGDAEVAASTLSSPFSLILDGGAGSNAIGLTSGAQFIWFNRFTPQTWNFPVILDEVQVMFGYLGTTGNINVGELIDIYLYEDADGNPTNGATHRVSLNDQEVQAVDGTTWSVYPLAEPVTFEGPGDIIIAVVNRTAGITPNTFPAVLDQLSGSQLRSWLGFGGGNPGDPPDFTAFSTFGLADSFGFPGNWLVRGFGQAFVACIDPADVPWLAVAPSSGTTEPGGATDVTVTLDSNGLSAGTYEAFLCVESNDPDMPLVTVPVTMEVTQAPVIGVGPAELASTQEVDTSATQNLTISNTGDADLVWTIEEQDTSASLLSTDLLYDQTANTTTQGALAIYDLDEEPEWVVQAADDFVVPEGETWTVHTVDARGFYQAFSNLPGVNVFFYEDDGGLPGAELYAYPNLTPTTDNNGQLILDLPQPAELTAGAYWLSIQPRMDFFADGVWYWFMQSAQANNEFAWRNPSDSYGSGCTDWGSASDCGFSFPDLTFQLIGARAGACQDLSDIAWLSVDPASGTTAPGNSSDVTVTFDASGLAEGVYSGNLCVASNDAATPLVIVPVEMTVEPTTTEYGVALSPATAALSGAPGDVVTYELNVTNNGNVADTFSFSAAGGAWSVGLPADVTLGAGASTTVAVTVAIPATAADGEDDTVTITATSAGDGTATASSNLTTTAVVEPPESFVFYFPFIARP